MKPGTLVRMSEQLKQTMIAVGCADHVEEFGECEGIVIGPMDYGTFQGPEVDVRWQPSNLRYGYSIEDLVVVGSKTYRSIDDTNEQIAATGDPLLRSRLFLRAKMKIRPS